MTKRILVSGFEAFGGQKINPTERLVEAVKRGEIATPNGCELSSVLLPVTFDGAFERLRLEMQRTDPQVVLALGQAGGRKQIEIERVAINCIDANIPDNLGHQPRDLKISLSGPEAYFTTLPFRAMQERLKENKIPVSISNSAGTYVCNFLFYRLQAMTRFSLRQTGFVHFPFLPEQVAEQVAERSDTPSLEFAVMKNALSSMLQVFESPIS